MAHTLRVGLSLPNANNAATGGLIIGGEGPGPDGVILKGGGNPAWPKIKATRLGSPTQFQIYPNAIQFSAWASGPDVLTTSGGTDLTTPDLYVDDSIWWNGVCYRVAQRLTRDTIRLKTASGKNPHFSVYPDEQTARKGGRIHTGYHVYHHARGQCSVKDGRVIRLKGDLFHRDHDLSVVIDGVLYRNLTRQDGNTLMVPGAPDATTVPYIYRGRPPEGAAYITLLRLQGRYGDSEEVAAHVITPERRYMIETQFAGDGDYMPMVFRTGPRNDWYSENKDFSSSRVAMTVDHTGSVTFGNGFRDAPTSARLNVVDDIPTGIKNDPNGRTRHDMLSLTSRYHGDHTNRRLVLGTFNDYVGPFLQAEDEAGMPMGMQLQPTEGKHSKVFVGKKGAPFPSAKLIVGDSQVNRPVHSAAMAPALPGKYDLGTHDFGFRSVYLDGGVMVTSCEGSPEGKIPAIPGSLCMDRDGGNPYVKNTGSGTTGWRKM
jgi:hypothetical protein